MGLMGSSGAIGVTELNWGSSETLGLFFAGLDGGVGPLEWWYLHLRDGREVVGVGIGNEKAKDSLALPTELGWAM